MGQTNEAAAMFMERRQGRWSGAIYVTCAVGNSDWSWQIGKPGQSTAHGRAQTRALTH